MVLFLRQAWRPALRLQTADCWLPTADCRLPTADCHVVFGSG